MSWQPIAAAGPAVQIHLATVDGRLRDRHLDDRAAQGHAARRGRVEAHRYTMISVHVGGIWIAGLFTLLPGRLLHRAVFGS